jgi:cytochrome P450
MLEMVEARRNADKEQRHDLFSGLLEAADDGEALNDEELLGGSLTSRSFGVLGKRLTRPS